MTTTLWASVKVQGDGTIVGEPCNVSAVARLGVGVYSVTLTNPLGWEELDAVAVVWRTLNLVPPMPLVLARFLVDADALDGAALVVSGIDPALAPVDAPFTLICWRRNPA